MGGVDRSRATTSSSGAVVTTATDRSRRFALAHVVGGSGVLLSSEACARDLGLIHNVYEYQIFMQEAAQFSTSKELRRLFVSFIPFILHGAPAPDIWEQFGSDLSLDFSMPMSVEASIQEACKHILMLNNHGQNTQQFGLPSVTHDNTELNRLANAFDRNEIRDLTQQLVPQMTVEQKHIFDVVTGAAL